MFCVKMAIKKNEFLVLKKKLKTIATPNNM